MRRLLKRYSYLFFVAGAGIICAMLYFGGYYYAVNYMDSDNLITKDDVRQSTPGINVSNATNEEILAGTASYIEEIYNADNDSFSKENVTLPPEYIGLSRGEIINIITKKVNENNDKTLLNIQLISFERDNLVVRKTICNPKTVYNYYVISENDIIFIYSADKQQLYINTEISIANFDDENKNELRNGFYIETIHDLYNYLEGVTS